MFYGQYNHCLDDKNRIIMPAKYREQLGSAFYITKELWGKSDDEKCLFVYSQESFEELESKLARMHASQSETRAMKRRFYSSVQKTEADKQGRAVISAELRAYAGLTKDIVLVGNDDHIEIWDKERWAAYDDCMQNLYESGILAESFDESGL